MMKKNHKVVLVTIIWIIILLLCGKFIYGIYSISSEEKQAIAIDTYNFEQLKKVKEVLKDIPEEDIVFRDLKELNKKYDVWIVPFNNCYYTMSLKDLDNYEWESLYIFWFQLESDKYKKKYGWEYYAYPKYDLPSYEVCAPASKKGNPFTVDVKDLIKSCKDFRRGDFEYTTSNPCKD